MDMDLDTYRRENNQRAVMKTLIRPSWLNTRAERAVVDFSQTLQDAPRSMLITPEPIMKRLVTKKRSWRQNA